MNPIVFVAVFGLAPGLAGYVSAGRAGWRLLIVLWAALFLSYFAVKFVPAMPLPTLGQPRAELAKGADQVRHVDLVVMNAIFGSAIAGLFAGKSSQWTVGLGAAAFGLMVGAALIHLGVI